MPSACFLAKSVLRFECCICFVFKHEQLLSNRNAGLRDDGKVGSRDMAAGDPAGLRDQVCFVNLHLA